MRVAVDEETLTGRAVDVRDRRDDGFGSTPSDLADAIRTDDGAVSSRSDGSPDPTVDCPTPGPVHGHVGLIRPEMCLSRRSALAAAARSLGHSAPQAEELASVRDRLDALDAPTIDLREARRRVADASDEAAELRERVATLQGRVQALAETNAAADDAEAELSAATRRLSEVETERIAAEQALARARERAKTSRERRRERLRLQDRADNLRRDAREHLAETVRGSFADARGSLPESSSLEDAVRDALAVARAAELEAPVVLTQSADPFDGATAAARWLGAPVIRA